MREPYALKGARTVPGPSSDRAGTGTSAAYDRIIWDSLRHKEYLCGVKVKKGLRFHLPPSEGALPLCSFNPAEVELHELLLLVPDLVDADVVEPHADPLLNLLDVHLSVGARGYVLRHILRGHHLRQLLVVDGCGEEPVQFPSVRGDGPLLVGGRLPFLLALRPAD